MDDGESAASRAATNGQLAAEPPAATTRTPSQGPRDRQAAVAELFAHHADAIFRYCSRMLRDPDRAEEVMQQVFLEAIRDFERFRGESSRRAWLFGIASHRCLDELRAQKKRRASTHRIERTEASSAREEVTDPEASERGPFEQLDHAQLLQALEDCLTLLSPEIRATVLLRFWTQLTHDQMTAHLGSTAEALQMRVSRAMLALRRCLENKGWAGE